MHQEPPPTLISVAAQTLKGSSTQAKEIPKHRPHTQLASRPIAPLPLRGPLSLPAGSGSGEASAASGGPAADPGAASWFQ